MPKHYYLGLFRTFSCNLLTITGYCP